MNEPVSQHYVPKMLLRNFTDNEEKLYFFDKDFPKKDVRISYPARLCRQDNIYTRLDENGNRNVSAEKSFAKLEGKCAPIIREIIQASRDRNWLQLTRTEKRSLDLFLVSQAWRTPDRVDPILWRDRMIRFIYDPEFRNMYKEEREKIEQETRLKNLTCNITEPNEEILSFLENKNLVIGISTSAEDEGFVIASNPVFLMEPQGHESEIWLPIAPDIAITCYSTRVNKDFIEFKDNDIRSFNESIFEQSRMIAGNSRELVKSVVAGRWGESLT